MLIKTLIEDYKDGTVIYNWVIYEHGHYLRPLVILDEIQVRQLIQQYCQFHGLSIVEKEGAKDVSDES